MAGRAVRYWRCDQCAATLMDPAQYLSRVAEKAHYDHHENTIDDPGYRAFLSKLTDPLIEALPDTAEGLDFGCGPGPALAAMLEEAGYGMTLYDPLYAPDEAALKKPYDFITASEVFEHLHDPAGTLDLLASLLRPGGIIAVMTCFQTDDTNFAEWHYRRDPTHVVFYRQATFQHIARDRNWTSAIPTKDVAFLTVSGQQEA